jgi:hypothetical protein
MHLAWTRTNEKIPRRGFFNLNKEKDGGRDKDRTCDPYDVNTVDPSETPRYLETVGHASGEKLPVPDTFLGHKLGADTFLKLAVVGEARMTLGKKAAADLWREMGLPLPETSSKSQGRLSPDVSDFLKDQVQFDACERLQASVLYRHYTSWARGAGRQVLSLTAFGRALQASDIRKRIGRLVTYEGVRLIVDNERPQAEEGSPSASWPAPAPPQPERPATRKRSKPRQLR